RSGGVLPTPRKFRVAVAEAASQGSCLWFVVWFAVTVTLQAVGLCRGRRKPRRGRGCGGTMGCYGPVGEDPPRAHSHSAVGWWRGGDGVGGGGAGRGRRQNAPAGW